MNASRQNEQDGCQNRSGEESKSAAENWAKWGGCQNSQVVCELGPPWNLALCRLKEHLERATWYCCAIICINAGTRAWCCRGVVCVFVSIADEGFPEELLTYFVKAPPPNGLPTPELGHRIWPASYPHISNLHLVEFVQKKLFGRKCKNVKGWIWDEKLKIWEMFTALKFSSLSKGEVGCRHLSARDITMHSVHSPQTSDLPPMGSAGVTDTLALPPFVHPVCSSKQTHLINCFPSFLNKEYKKWEIKTGTVLSSFPKKKFFMIFISMKYM